MTTCDRLEYAWGPHDGCREFMDEPDVFVCGQTAPWATVVRDTWYGTVEVLHTCDEHHDDLLADECWPVLADGYTVPIECV